MTEQDVDAPPPAATHHPSGAAAEPTAETIHDTAEGVAHERRLLRLLSAVLVVLWAATAIAVATAYRPGGPLDIVVALACFVPVVVADAGVVWPAEGVSRPHRLALVWVWIVAVLFAVPVLYGIASTVTEGGPRSLVPSYEEAYALILALVPMAFFSIVGAVHRRQGVRPLERRATATSALAAAMLTGLAGLAFVFVAVVNDQALRREEPAASRFGPTDPNVEPPFCDEPVALGEHARIRIEATSSLDDVTRGRALVEGRRDGGDESWSGTWDGPDGSGRLAYVRVGPRAWLNLASDDRAAPGTTWQVVPPDPFDLRGSQPLTLDGPPHDVADAPRGELVAEDLGLVVVEGARARHCRTFIDGDIALDVALPLRWLLADDSFARGAVPRWRGELDWWVFTDGELGRARVEVSGSRAETEWDTEGVRAALSATLEATRRDAPVDVTAPATAGSSPALPTSLESGTP